MRSTKFRNQQSICVTGYKVHKMRYTPALADSYNVQDLWLILLYRQKEKLPVDSSYFPAVSHFNFRFRFPWFLKKKTESEQENKNLQTILSRRPRQRWWPSFQHCRLPHSENSFRLFCSYYSTWIRGATFRSNILQFWCSLECSLKNFTAGVINFLIK